MIGPLAESEYAAWVAAFGFRVNHFTVDVGALSTFPDLEALDAFLVEPVIWKLEFSRHTNEYSGLRATTEGLVNLKRRQWTPRAFTFRHSTECRTQPPSKSRALEPWRRHQCRDGATSHPEWPPTRGWSVWSVWIHGSGWIRRLVP